jgi:hypothetical protein
MNDLNAAEQWGDVVSHLVRAHGAESGRLIGYALSLGQLLWVHFDMHAALDIAQRLPPDGHAHSALLDPQPDEQSLWIWFLTSPAGRKGHAPTWAPQFVAMSEYTCLPQTGASPGREEDLTGRWPHVALGKLRAQFEARGEPDPDQALAGFRDDLTHRADVVAVRWLARPGIIPVRTARRPGRQVSRRADAAWLAGISFPGPVQPGARRPGGQQAARRAPPPGPPVNRRGR